MEANGKLQQIVVKKTKVSYEKSRLKELLWLMIEKHQAHCAICHKPFTKETDLPSRGSDQLTEHHKDGQHYNNDLSNRVLVHRTCHKSYHTKDNVNFWGKFK